MNRSARRRPDPPRGRKPETRTRRSQPKPVVFDGERSPSPVCEPFLLGAVAGTTPGRWVDTWRERLPQHPIEVHPVTDADARSRLLSGQFHALLLRRPFDTAGLHAIDLYEEVAVVVAAADSHLTAGDTLVLADLHGETLLVPDDDVLAPVAVGTEPPARGAPATSADLVELVAAGGGIGILPASIARLHARRDVAVRQLEDGPTSTVALVWPVDRTTPDVETFIGIVRGRTARSSRN